MFAIMNAIGSIKSKTKTAKKQINNLKDQIDKISQKVEKSEKEKI